MNKCLECGMVVETDKEKCESCNLEKRKKCSYCEIVLRDNPTIKYAYDNNEYLREGENPFKANKHLIREFKLVSKVNYPKKNESICLDCDEYKKRIKRNYLNMNKCYCGNSLIKSLTVAKLIDYVKENGFFCKTCLYDADIFPESLN